MWPAALSRTRGGTRRPWWRSSRPRALENRFATLRHGPAQGPAGSGTRGGSRRGQIHRARASLRNNQAARLSSSSGLTRTRRSAGTSSSLRRRCNTIRRRRRDFGFQLRGDLNFSGFHFRQRNFSFVQNSNLLFHHQLGRPRCFDCGWCVNSQRGRWHGCRRLGWSYDRSRRTHHRLGCNKTGRFGRFYGCCRSGAGSRRRRLSNRGRWPCRNRRRGRHRLSRRTRHGLGRKRGRACSYGTLDCPLLDGFPHIAWLGDMR